MPVEVGRQESEDHKTVRPSRISEDANGRLIDGCLRSASSGYLF